MSPGPSTKSSLIVMLKYPRPGAVKTRLVPALGGRKACELYQTLVRHTLDEARRFASEFMVSLSARVANGPDNDAVRHWLGEGIHFQSQGGGDLGRRMERAVKEAFAEGASRVVVIGADCAELTGKHLDSAFRALESRELVVGPAADGGYYLMGLRCFVPELFRNIHWGTGSVLDETVAAARRAGVECELLETLQDVDRPEDLNHWARSDPAVAAGRSGVSVIIPALNEARDLARTLESAQHGQPHEIIVVDGGSADETVRIARSMDAVVLAAAPCRAAQMNCGAAIASGEYLLFLHADTLLPSDYAAHIRKALGKPGVTGGAFALAIAGDFAGRRWVERAANWRARRRQFPYGDQALFARRETFHKLGGFPEMPIMEDYEFVRRLRRTGRILIASAHAVTSGRRWQRLGWLRTTLLNRAIVLAYHLGVSPHRLAAWYRGRFAQRDSFLAAPRDSGAVPGMITQANRSHP